MKKGILLVIALSLAIIGFSQIDFPKTSATWKYVFYDNTEPAVSKVNFHLLGDTLINNVTYQKTEEGFLRTEDKKVYFLPNDSVETYLLYDFNLDIGDGFPNTWGYVPGEPDTAYVQQIDSVLTNFGYRKRWRFEQGGEWIEGIGSTWLLTRPIYQKSVSGFYSLLCFENGDSLVFEEEITYDIDNIPIIFNCDDFVSILIEPDIEHLIQISPNPVKNTLNIITPPIIPLNTSIYFHSTNGQLIRIYKSTSNSIALGSIPSGVYFISFIINQQKYITKLVKL